MHTILFLILAATVATPATQPTVQTEIIVTATALPETESSVPATVTVITREDIDQREARDVADVLREVPGVVMSRTGSQGRVTSLFMRGSNSNHTLVLWNGIEITNPYFAGYDWGRFSTNAVEKVEVVRGPFSALYGSDAVAGVVNVITTPRRSMLQADVAHGAHGFRDGDVTASLVSREGYATVSYESRKDDGFAPNDDFDQDSFNVALRWMRSDLWAIGATARYTKYDLGIPMNTNAFGTELVPSPNRRQDGNERQVAIPVELSLGRFFNELTIAESRRDDDFTDPDDPFALVDTSTESTTRRARLTTRVQTGIGMIVAGGEWEKARVDDLTNFGANLDDQRRTEKSFFVEDRFRTEVGPGGHRSALDVSAGVRYDDFDTFGSETSPRVAAAWFMNGNKIRAAFGEAFRAPSIGELYFPFFGNDTLEAERSRSWEVGYDRFMESGQFSATLFRSHYDDLIVFGVATNRFENVGAANAKGIELSLDRKLGDALRTTISYTYTDTNEEGRDRPLRRRPRHSASLFLGHRSGSVDTNLVVLYTGSREDVLPVFPFTDVTDKSYTTVDANVQWHFGRFTPYVKVENATNVRYEEVRGFPSPRRRAIVGVRLAM